MSEGKFNIEDILSTFGSNQQRISAAETKLVQLKRACKHKDEQIDRLLQEQTSLQNESYDLNKRESAILIEIENVQKENDELKISRSNTQLALSKKERELAEMEEKHKKRIAEKTKEIDSLNDSLVEERESFRKQCQNNNCAQDSSNVPN